MTGCEFVYRDESFTGLVCDKDTCLTPAGRESGAPGFLRLAGTM